MPTNNLLEISKLAARFFRSLTSTKHHSYSDLATEIKLSRNVLYYFASEGADEDSQSATIKLNAFSKILNWLEKSDLDRLCKTAEQRHAAAQLREAMTPSDRVQKTETGQFASLLTGFTLAEEQVFEVLEQLPNMLIGIRQRGTTRKFQISIHRFQKAESGDAVTWDMTFLQGTDPFDKKEIARHLQEGVSISGYAIPMENTLTCVGRLQKQANIDHNLSMMNIILKNPEELRLGKKLYQGSFYGYSRREAISRHMLFISTDQPATNSPMILSGRMGDVCVDTLTDVYPEAISILKQGVLGFSVGIDGKKVNKLLPAKE